MTPQEFRKHWKRIGRILADGDALRLVDADVRDDGTELMYEAGGGGPGKFDVRHRVFFDVRKRYRKVTLATTLGGSRGGGHAAASVRLGKRDGDDLLRVVESLRDGVRHDLRKSTYRGKPVRYNRFVAEDEVRGNRRYRLDPEQLRLADEHEEDMHDMYPAGVAPTDVLRPVLMEGRDFYFWVLAHYDQSGDLLGVFCKRNGRTQHESIVPDVIEAPSGVPRPDGQWEWKEPKRFTRGGR